jgi:hypothetical protein
MNRMKLRKLSITLSAVAWFTFVAFCLVPMSEGGLAAFASLVMVGVFTVILALDIFGTLSLDKPRMGCLGVLYFVAWALVLGFSALLIMAAPFMLRGEAARIPLWGKLLIGLFYAVPAGFALVKILIGRALRRTRKSKGEEQRGHISIIEK